jgi:hypothetical protein
MFRVCSWGRFEHCSKGHILTNVMEFFGNFGCKLKSWKFTADRMYNIDEIGVSTVVRGGADKSLARPGRKQATATKLGIYSTYSPRSSIHSLARCSNFCKTLKKKSPSNQVSTAVITSASDEKWRPFNCFFSPGNRW